MPVEYKEFLGTVGRNQVRLWELSAVKYIAAPASILQQFSKNPQLGKLFNPVLNYQVPTAQGMRKDVLLEFKGAIPRFALFHNWNVLPLEKHCEVLASPRHNSQTTLLVSTDSGLSTGGGNGNFQPLDAVVTKKSATIEVQAEEPAVLRFSQHVQPGWKVFVDGKEEDLLTVDYLCMGVSVPIGEHIVEFRCVNGIPKAAFSTAVFMLSLLCGMILVCGRRGHISE